MTTRKVIIVDYGVGNLLSIQRAVEKCGAEAITSSEPDVIAKADRVILPGVGAFKKGMKALESLGLAEAIKELAASGTPLLGICLGMQLLLDESEEHGLTKGLGIIPGRVVRVSNFSSDGTPLKIPHIGWNSLVIAEDAQWNGIALKNSANSHDVYFVHSFMAVPEDRSMLISHCLYGGNRISAIIAKENVIGYQFHPEKSGLSGIKLLQRFLYS